MQNRRDVLALLVFAAVLVAGALLMGWIGSAGNAAETDLVRDAVKNAALTCYAVEGAYPSSLDYLREHYGLAYDENRYLVVYDAFASNLMPEIRVREKVVTAP